MDRAQGTSKTAVRRAGYRNRRVHGTSLSRRHRMAAAEPARTAASFACLLCWRRCWRCVLHGRSGQRPGARWLPPNSSKRCGPRRRRMGVSRATFDAALRGVEPDLALPDLVLPGKSDVKGQAEFTRTPAQYLSAPYLAKLTRAGQGPADAARHLARQDRARARRAAPVRARHLGPGDGVRCAQIELLRRQGARHAGLSRPPQGPVPHRAAVRAEDAAGRRAHARDHDRIMGRCHGPHPVHALGILHRRLRPRRRRSQGHLGLGGGRLGISGQPAARQGLGAEPELGLRGAPAQGRLLPAGGTRQRQAAQRVGEARRRARERRFPRPARWTSRPSF